MHKRPTCLLSRCNGTGEICDGEQEFLLRLQERDGNSVDRYAILQCSIGEQKSYSHLKPFLEFERKQAGQGSAR